MTSSLVLRSISFNSPKIALFSLLLSRKISRHYVRWHMSTLFDRRCLKPSDLLFQSTVHIPEEFCTMNSRHLCVREWRKGSNYLSDGQNSVENVKALESLLAPQRDQMQNITLHYTAGPICPSKGTPICVCVLKSHNVTVLQNELNTLYSIRRGRIQCIAFSISNKIHAAYVKIIFMASQTVFSNLMVSIGLSHQYELCDAHIYAIFHKGQCQS